MGSEQLARTPTDQKLGHQALSLGLRSSAPAPQPRESESAGCDDNVNGNSGLARLNGARNPYAELIPPDVQTFTDLQMDHAQRMGVPAVVSLLGGIGDHLEVISMLLEWSRIDAHPLILRSPSPPKGSRPLDRVHPPTCAAKQRSSAGNPGHGDARMDLQTLRLHPLRHLDH